MKYRTVNLFTGDIVTGKKRRKMVDPNSEIKQMMQNRYTYIQVNGGRPDGWGAVKDLADHARKKMPASMKRWIALYGAEWKAISKAARAATGWRCEECDREFDPVNLHVHHIKPISLFVSQGATFTEEHECFGVTTKRPYHVEENLRVLCKEHHGDEHGRAF